MITVPKSALSAPDDKGEAVDPEVGDLVDLGAVQAKVTGIEGDNYTLDVESVNGAKCIGCDGEDDIGEDQVADESDGADSAETGLPLSKEGKALMAKAASADKRAGRV